MRILMINVVCGIKSTGRICTDLATALESDGHEVKIAYGRDSVPDRYKKYALRIGTDMDVATHGIKARISDGCGFGSTRATRRFVRWIEDFEPDVIHLHNLHGYYINVEILFKYLKTCGKRVIWTLHDCWAFTGHSAYCDVVDCEKWRDGCRNCPMMRWYPKSIVDCSERNWKRKKELFTGVPNLTIVSPSEWLAMLVKESFLGAYQVRTIHNGIETQVFKPIPSTFKEDHGIANKFMVLGVATAWDEMKGLSDYYSLSKVLGEDYRVVLVGLSEKQIETLPDTLTGLPRTNDTEELARIYSAADLFVNLSYCENYPTVNLEAIACGTRVLTYNVGGSSESALSGGGIVVDKGDIDGVAKEIVEHAKSESNGKRKTLPIMELDKERTTSEYVKLLEEML